MRRCLLLLSERKTGVVTTWHPFERRGTVRCTADGSSFVVDAMCFESVMPSAHRDLVGATVTFKPSSDPPMKSAKSIVRSRTDDINSSNVFIRRRADPLEPFRIKGDSSISADVKELDDNGMFRGATAGPFAVEVEVDMMTVKQTYHPADKASIIEGGMAPPIEVKDMRVSSLFSTKRVSIRGRDDDEVLMSSTVTNPRRVNATEKKFEWDFTESAAMKQDADALKTAAPESAVDPEFDADPTIRRGYFLTWSSVYKSGLIVEADDVPTAELLESLTEDDIMPHAHIVRGVGSFLSALPTSVSMHLRRVEFRRVKYAAEPKRRYAKDIVLIGDLQLQSAERSLEYKPSKYLTNAKKANGATLTDEGDSRLPRVPPTGRSFGVVVRWSGGQGALETGEGYLYFIESVKSFEQLVQSDGQGIRGAVVTFLVDPVAPKLARSISILSLTTPSLAHGGPAKPSAPLVSAASVYPSKPNGAPSVAVSSPEKLQTPPPNMSPPAEDDVWVEGTLVTWLPLEHQGLIQGDDGNRYVLQDAATNVIDFKTLKSSIRRGARVRLTPFGSSKRLAANVVVTTAMAEESDVAKADMHVPTEEQRGAGGTKSRAPPPDGAIHSDADIWTKRLKTAGIDMSESDKERAARRVAVDPSESPEGTDDVFKCVREDKLVNDPQLNKKYDNSDVTYMEAWMASPLANQARAAQLATPAGRKKVEEQFNKKFSEQQKEAAYLRSQEMVPKLKKLYQEIRNSEKSNTGGVIHFH